MSWQLMMSTAWDDFQHISSFLDVFQYVVESSCCGLSLLWTIILIPVLDVHGLSILSTWLKHLNGLSYNCVYKFHVLWALCSNTLKQILKQIPYPLFGYRLCFSVVCDMSSESDPHPAETIFLHVPALLPCNFDVCVVQSLKFIEFWFSHFIGVFYTVNSQLLIVYGTECSLCMVV